MENRELRETLNVVEITGTLKENNIECFTLKDGREAIRGNVVVEVKDGDKIHNHKIEVFSMRLKSNGEENGLYKGYKTVMDEYKDRDTHGDEADRVSVQGSIDINDFTTKTGEFVSNNTISGLFFNRVSLEHPDRAVGNLELVINSQEILPCESQSSESGKDYVFSGYSVDYFHKGKQENRIIPVNNIKVSEGLFKQIQPHYKFGETVKISVVLNNYALVEKTKPSGAAFGEMIDLDTTTEYVNEIRMIGGEMPEQGEKKFNDDDKVLIEKYRQGVVDTLKGTIPANDFPPVGDMAFSDVPMGTEVPDFEFS